jgi:glycosyltransferase involved in cell wall biosynthesis
MSLHTAVSGWLLGPPSGANRRLLGLLAAMRGRLLTGERVTVLHARGFAVPFEHPSVRWQPVAIPGAPTFRRVRAERRLLPGLLRELEASVLDHGLLPAPKIPCPLCLTIHDVRDADGEGRRWRWLARTVLSSSLARAAAVVVPSGFTKARVLAHAANAPPIHVIANVASLPLARAAGRGWFLHVGHLEARKNLGLLVNAFAQLPTALRAQHPLRLAGADAGEGGRLRRLAVQRGIAAQVQFAGPVSDDELPALYAGAVAVCVPSRYEGSGLCALEGLAAGRPVLVSDRGALPEQAGARVLPADDPAPWTAAMAEAAAQPVPPRPTDVFPDPWQPGAAGLLEVWRSVAAGGLPVRGVP